LQTTLQLLPVYQYIEMPQVVIGTTNANSLKGVSLLQQYKITMEI